MEKVTKEEINSLLSKRVKTLDSLQIPHFSLLVDDKSINRVLEAVKRGEKIAVVGDYDVDGVVSAALMKLFFKKTGVDVDIVIPERFKDGYGFSNSLLERIDAGLIITVDNGISSFEAVGEAKKRGIDVIVTDHHTPLSENGKIKLPDAFSIINPRLSEKFPYKEICGAEVAWYFCAGLKGAFGVDVDMREFLDIVSIAIIADVMPLVYLNRTLFNIGIKRLNNPSKPFSLVLKEKFKEIKSEDIAFNIAPRLNSAGRLESAKLAYEFLVAESYAEAKRIYEELDRLNSKRKEIERDILASIKVESGGVIVVKGDFHEGVIGIIASRLVSLYKKPAIVFSKKGNLLKGSGRSLGNVDIFKMVNGVKWMLESFGGHKLACGLSIREENFNRLKEELDRRLGEYDESDFFEDDFVVGRLDFEEIDEGLLEIIERYEPYGEGHLKPKFISKAEVLDVKNLKENHYKLTLSQNSKILPAVIFRYDGEFGDEIEFKFSVSKDCFGTLQLIIEEIM